MSLPCRELEECVRSDFLRQEKIGLFFNAMNNTLTGRRPLGRSQICWKDQMGDVLRKIRGYYRDAEDKPMESYRE